MRLLDRGRRSRLDVDGHDVSPLPWNSIDGSGYHCSVAATIAIRQPEAVHNVPNMHLPALHEPYVLANLFRREGRVSHPEGDARPLRNVQKRRVSHSSDVLRDARAALRSLTAFIAGGAFLRTRASFGAF
eukprot:scaffold405_cov243-Pinguiococcus_pyrenoidosus.AAC.20